MTSLVGRRLAFAGACLAAVAVLVAAYSNSFQNALHFDDSHVVEDNLYIRSLTNVPLFFRDASTATSLPTNAVYRPLVPATLALDYWLAGRLDVRQFHVSQFVMLMVLGVLLFFFFLKIFALTEERWWNRYLALAAVLLVSVHTTTTETMNLIHVRSELLSGMGLVGSFLVYLYFPRSRPTHVYLVPMMVGALAKPPAVMFAPLFVVYLVLFEQKLSVRDLFQSRSWTRVRDAIVRGLPALIAGVAVFLAISAMDAPTVDYAGGSRPDYLRTQFFVWLHYARLFFLPLGLTADTDWGVIGEWYDTRVVAGLMFVAFVLWAIWRASARADLRPVAFGLAWFALALLPASSVFPLAEVANEHRVFLPYAGLALAVVSGAAVVVQHWSTLQPRFRPVFVSGAVVLALVAIGGNAVGTYERNKVWRSGETLWRDVTEKSPANGRGLMNYGLTQMANGRFKEAKQLFDRAQVFNPNYATLEINLGIVTDRLGDKQGAEAHFTRALKLAPDAPNSHFYFARWLVEQGRLASAVPHLKRAIELSPGQMPARYLLLETLARTGQASELKAMAADTLRLVPGDAQVTAYLDDRRGPVPPALTATARHVETADDLLNTSLRLYQAGDFDGCIDAAKKALELKPDYAEAHNNIAAAYASLKQWENAIQAASEALRLRPDYPLARANLRWAEGERLKQAAPSTGPR